MVRQGPEVVAGERSHELVVEGTRRDGRRGGTVVRPSCFRRGSLFGGGRSKVRGILANTDGVGGHSGGQAFNRLGLVSKIMPFKC
jgi:hypothetical protein